MTDNVQSLNADRNVIRILEEALADAKAGRLVEVVILGYTNDPESPWDYHIGPTKRLTAWIGHLEMTKQAWIADVQSRID
jgi:hypothetical protein